MGKKIDMTGWVMKEHGVEKSLLTVLKEEKNYAKQNNLKSTGSYWKCRCECGTEKIIHGANLRSGATLSCGCYNSKQVSLRSQKNLIGMKFGRLTPIELIEERTSSGGLIWRCLCDCGNKTNVPSTHLIGGETTSCGCYWKEQINKALSKDISNQKFGKLTALKPTNKKSGSSILWECKCDCGEVVLVRSSHLTSGAISSCGCQRSKGENKIYNLLKENNIPFEREKTFDDLFFKDTGRKARFDFYVNNSFLVEFDGSQHYFSKNSGWNTEENLLKTQEHDKIKNEYCFINNIPLKRIPYYAFNTLTIEDILSDKYLIKGEN